MKPLFKFRKMVVQLVRIMHAVITTGLNSPDALSAKPLEKDAPLLLTDQYALSNCLKNELIRLRAKEVFLVGGYIDHERNHVFNII
jgi:hypothetical protein